MELPPFHPQRLQKDEENNLVSLKPRVTVLIPCRNGQQTLPRTVDSLLRQTVHTDIVVADDHSIDETHRIIKDLTILTAGRVRSITYPNREPKNYDRVPLLINMANRVAPPADYYMISGDDNVYPPNYLETLIGHMEKDRTELASGYNVLYNPTYAPTGGGRLMTAQLWKQLSPLPLSCSWDTWMLLKMTQLGVAYGIYPIKKQPIRKNRRIAYSHGHAAYLLGTPLLFTVIRVVNEVLRGNSPILATSILVGHLEYSLRRVPQMDISPFVHQLRKMRVVESIRSPLLKLLRRVKNHF